MNFSVNTILYSRWLKVAQCLFWVPVVVLFWMGSTKYIGSFYVYLMFSVVANLLLYCGFRKNAIFFDTFIGVFFWLGFWLKFTVRIAFHGGGFTSAPYFDGTGLAFDHSLLVSTCGLFALVVASFAREKFLFSYPKTIYSFQQEGLLELYKRYRKVIWFIFAFLILFVGLSNAYWGIYQRGTLPGVKLPFGLNGIYTWLLMFGLASVSAVMIKLEMELNKQCSTALVIMGLFESFVSNVSMLSRGMLLNAAALLYGGLIALKKYTVNMRIPTAIVIVTIFFCLFATSVVLVNYLRLSIFFQPHVEQSQSAESVMQRQNAESVTKLAGSAFINRWLGIEEVIAVSSYPQLGWDVWQEAWKETPTQPHDKTHFYDKTFTHLAQVEIDRTKYHFIASLPGVVAFFFYPGSLLFLFVSMFLLGWLAAGLEYFTYKFSGMNVILGAFFAQVIAFRFLNFGYVPTQSYMLLGALLLNVILIYFANRFLVLYYKKPVN